MRKSVKRGGDRLVFSDQMIAEYDVLDHLAELGEKFGKLGQLKDLLENRSAELAKKDPPLPAAADLFELPD
jgi:hypothetical protein